LIYSFLTSPSTSTRKFPASTWVNSSP